MERKVDTSVVSSTFIRKFDEDFSLLYLKNRKKNPIDSYDYSNYSITSLAVLAKTDLDALNALAKAFENEIDIYCKSVTRNRRYLDYDEIKFKLHQAFLRSVNFFKEEYGSFTHFLRKSLKNAIKFHIKEKALANKRAKKYLGDKVSDFDIIDYLYDSNFTFEMNHKWKQVQNDVENYLDKINDKDKKIIKLYQTGYTFKDICKLTKESFSKVSYTIYNTIKDIRKNFNITC